MAFSMGGSTCAIVLAILHVLQREAQVHPDTTTSVSPQLQLVLDCLRPYEAEDIPGGTLDLIQPILTKLRTGALQPPKFAVIVGGFLPHDPAYQHPSMVIAPTPRTEIPLHAYPL